MGPVPDTALPDAKEAFDVLIVGSGPAGGAAALELAGRGLKVAVIEKAVPPRYKTCGGGVLWRAVKRLPIDIRSTVDRECRVAELVWHQPPLRFACRREHPVVTMVMRDRFDYLLLSAAIAKGDIRLVTGTAVKQILLGPELVRVVTDCGELRARMVIAADGINSVVARSTGCAPLDGVMPALECEAAYSDSVQEPYLKAARFDFGLVAAGYGWVFPKSGHLSIGVGTTRRGADSLPRAYERYLAELGLQGAATEQRHGYMIPCRPRSGLFDRPQIFLTGDAAGLADPVTAEGITAAIVSGQLAARAILSHRDSPARAMRQYRSELRDTLLKDLAVARWLAWLLYERPKWCSALLTRHGAGMSELMARIVTGETTYRAAVRRPGYYLRLLRPRRSNAKPPALSGNGEAPN